MVRTSNQPSLEGLLTKLRRHMPVLKREHRIKSLAVFGSYARGDQTEESDLDLLIEFEEGAPLTLIGFIELQDTLSDLLGVKVDLVERQGLKPRLCERVAREALAI